METDVKPKNMKTPDRVNLGALEAEKINKWLVQVNSSSRGFLALTKTDVVNFLIRQHRDELLPKELLQIRAQNYDPVRHLNWIAPQIKLALASGDLERVAELQEELRGVELSVVHGALTKQQRPPRSASETSRRRKSKSKNELDSTTENSENVSRFEENQDALPEG